MKKSPIVRRRFPWRPAILVAAVLLLAGGYLGYRATRPSPHNETSPAAEKQVENIDMSPATEEDKQRAETHKENLARQQEQQAQAPSGQRSVTPVIVDANHYGEVIEVRSFVPDLFEDGGTCTVTFKKGGSTITKTTNGVKDATTTRCEMLSVSRSEFSAGVWTAQVSYSSQSAAGSSETREFEVR